MTATLALLGDLRLGQALNAALAHRTPESFWGDVLPLLQRTDGAIATLAGAITMRQELSHRVAEPSHFRADPSVIELLRAANIRSVNLANRHVLDFDNQGLLDTLHYLDLAGIQHTGAGRNLHEAMATAWLDFAGIKIGMIATTENEIALAAEHDTPGVHYLEVSCHRETLARVQLAIAQARQAGADFIILSAQPGASPDALLPLPRFRDFAQAAIESGVDLVYGHSDHIFQRIEAHQQGIILYNIGTILSDASVDAKLHNDWSFVVLLELSGKQLQRLQLVPVRLQDLQVNIASGDDFVAICDRMQMLSKPFGTHFEKTVNGLEIKIRNRVP